MCGQLRPGSWHDSPAARPPPPCWHAAGRQTRGYQSDESLDSPTLTRVLARAPLLRLEQVVLEEPLGPAAAAGSGGGGGEGEEGEGEGSSEGEGEHRPPSPRQLLRGVRPAGA